MLIETSDYDKLYREFRWDVPARFNIAAVCCDRHANGSGRLALIDVGEDGGTQRLSFDEMSALSCRFANVLKTDGLERGECRRARIRSIPHADPFAPDRQERGHDHRAEE